MAKRKRGNPRNPKNERPYKRLKSKGDEAEISSEGQIEHPVLSQYYARVVSLRGYVRTVLSHTSKRRLRILDHLRAEANPNNYGRKKPSAEASQAKFGIALSILDGVLVGECKSLELDTEESTLETLKDYEAFSQQLALSGSALKSQLGSQNVSLSEVVDYAIWLLFNKRYPKHHKPPHILCHGFFRASSTWQGLENGPCGIPGLVQVSENEYLRRLKGPPWQAFFTMLGGKAARIMIHLITNCGLFMPVDTSLGCYYQVSGQLLSDLKVVSATTTPIEIQKPTAVSHLSKPVLHKNPEIRFVRSRMLYARAALNSKGDVAFGLRHIHVLNRYPDHTKIHHTTRVMMYVFPRQFGLHNVFTSQPDPKETAQQFQDYTLREREIAKLDLTRSLKVAGKPWLHINRHIPRRLRGIIVGLIQRVQKKQVKCPYSKLLEHYCPLPEAASTLVLSKSQSSGSQIEKGGFKGFATPAAQVSAFCRAVFNHIFPSPLLGGTENIMVLHKHIDLFLKNRRFENFTLASVMSGLKIKNIEWLRLPDCEADEKLSLSDYYKRLDIVSELVYYLFDSFLVPLVRTNFHATESGTNRNKLYYFRHDIWRRLTEPALNSLKISIFDEIGGEKALNDIKKRTLGYTQLRLLPKEKGMRPISNLRRRPLVKSNGLNILGRSINSTLSPAFHVLNFEKIRQPNRLGSSLFSVAGMYQKLADFRESMVRRGPQNCTLFFAKVDVKGCFDSIPQGKMTELVQQLLSNEEYSVAHIAELRRSAISSKGVRGNPTKRYSAMAYEGLSEDLFEQLLAQKHGRKPDRPNTVYVDSAVRQRVPKSQILKLLKEHIEYNIVKIGKKYYRQRQGIAQGSVVSSLLCNFFYGDLEEKMLGFLNDSESLLFRLIDDFLLITTNKVHAMEFLGLMHSGIPSYGVAIKPEKTLINFDASVDGMLVPRLADAAEGFPYCGMLIDCNTLNLSKDFANSRKTGLADTLTVEYSRHPGDSFRRKMLAGLQLQMHTMLLDTSHNTRVTVLNNLFQTVLEVSMKSYEYIRCLGRHQQPSALTLKRLIEDLCGLAFAMMKSWRNKQRRQSYLCTIGRDTTKWLILRAFVLTYGLKQSRFGLILPWLNASLAACTKACGHEVTQLEAIAQATRSRKYGQSP